MKTDIYEEIIESSNTESSAGIRRAENAKRMRERTDLRISNSDRKIRLALAKLMCQKPLDKISVSDIVREAGVCRGTFYAYYPDVEKLAKVIRREIHDSVERAIREYGVRRFLDNPDDLITRFFIYLSKNKEYWRYLVSSPEAIKFWFELVEEFTPDVTADIMRYANSDSSKRVKFYASIMIISLRDAAMLFLNDSIRGLEPEDFANMISSLIRENAKNLKARNS